MTLRDYALYYTGLGIAIVPLRPKSKIPAIKNWQNEATTDTGQINHWWWENPYYNIGMVTGEKSGGIVVIDLDEHPEAGKYGIEIARDWQRDHGRFPDTWEAVTGSGGRHLFFRTFDNPRREQHLFHSSVDFQADEALITLPPSIHPDTGKVYYWDLSPEEAELAHIDDNVLAFIKTGMAERDTPHLVSPESASEASDSLIYEGTRVCTLHRLLSRLKAMGLSDENIRAVVYRENGRRCVPPLTDRELEKEVFPALKRYAENSASAYYRSFRMMDVLERKNRIDYLVRLIYHMKYKNVSDEAVRSAVEVENRLKCYPPLTSAELTSKVFTALDKFKGGGKPIERRRQLVRFGEISSLE